MSTYVIGDVQGCYDPLQALLTHLHFDDKKDKLIFTGDLVNRGPHSLEVLRFVKSLGDKHVAVLGNHDLHLLAVLYGCQSKNPLDTFDGILSAPDREELKDWMRHLPLLHQDQGYVISHAGIGPLWSVEKASSLAHEVESILRSDEPIFYLNNMYGNTPDAWHDDLAGEARLRCITNYLTRMRFCYPDGRLDLVYKGNIQDKPEDLIPWFHFPERVNKAVKIVFGHWAHLNGIVDAPNVYALDTGCVYGNALTALRLEDAKRFTVPCRKCTV